MAVTDPVDFAPIPGEPAASVTEAFKVKLTLVDKVVRMVRTTFAGKSVTRVMRRAVELSTVTLAALPVAENVPMLGTPLPVMAIVVPAGTAEVALAVSRNPGPMTAGTPQLPIRVNAPASPLAALAGADTATAKTGTDQAALVRTVRRLIAPGIGSTE